MESNSRTVPVTISMPVEMAEAAQIIAVLERKSRSELIRNALSERIARQLLEESCQMAEVSHAEA